MKFAFQLLTDLSPFAFELIDDCPSVGGVPVLPNPGGDGSDGGAGGGDTGGGGSQPPAGGDDTGGAGGSGGTGGSGEGGGGVGGGAGSGPGNPGGGGGGGTVGNPGGGNPGGGNPGGGEPGGEGSGTGGGTGGGDGDDGGISPTGGGPGSGGGDDDDDGGGGEVIVPTFIAQIITVEGQIVEGETLEICAQINMPSVNRDVVIPVTLTAESTVDLSDVTLSPMAFRWPAGETEAKLVIETDDDAAQGGMRSLVLELDPDGVLPPNPALDPDEPDLSIVAMVLPRRFPIRGEFQIVNAVEPPEVEPTPPSFSWLRDSATFAEGTGFITFALVLDAPSQETQVISVTATPLTAAEGVDYAFPTQEFQFEPGVQQQEVTIELLENTQAVENDPRLRLDAESVSGGATAGEFTSLTITIEDNDVLGPPTVEFSSLAAVAIPEGQTRMVNASLTRDGQPIAFRSDTSIPVTLTGSTEDFLVTYPLGATGAIRFGAGESSATLDVTAIDDGLGDAGDAMEITIDPPTTDLYQIGARNQVVLVATEPEATDPSRLWVPEIAGSAPALRQFSAAVVPPSAQLPIYEIEGQQTQVVGHRRDKNGLWNAAYVYGLASSAKSTPYRSDERRVEPQQGVAPPPASGSFLQPPEVAFSVQIADGSTYTCTTQFQSNVIDATSPTGMFPQVGADLCREALYRMRPRLQGTTGSMDEPSGELMGSIELAEQRIAGETNIVIYEGRFANSAWRHGQDPRAENDWCDGVVNLRSITGGLPPGWEFINETRHPFQNASSANVEELLTLESHDHQLEPGQSYMFWFVAVRSGVPADVRQRAIDYYDRKHIGAVIGGFGATRNPIQDDVGEMTPDYERLEYQFQGLRGYQGLERLAEVQLNDVSPNQRIKEGWTLGAPQSGGFGGLQGRFGWSPYAGPARGGATGGSAIDGQSGQIPYWTRFFHARHVLAAHMARNRWAVRDVVDNRTAWWWNVTALEDGEYRIWTQGNMFTSWGSSIIPHMLDDSIDRNAILTNANENALAPLRLAPSNRPWNQSEPGRRDTGLDDVQIGTTNNGDPIFLNRNGVEPFAGTHSARNRLAYNIGWIQCRSWMAFQFWEELAARGTRVFPPAEPFNDIASALSFNVENNNLARLRRIEAPSQHRGRGYRWTGSFFETVGNHRSLGWPLIDIVGFYCYAPDDIREGLNGGGPAQAVGGASFFDDWRAYLEYSTTPAGNTVRVRNREDVWRVANTGIPNLANQTGAMLTDEIRDVPEQFNPDGLNCEATRTFFQVYVSRGIAALLQHVLPDGVAESTNLGESARILFNYHEGMRARGLPPGRRYPLYLLVSILEGISFSSNNLQTFNGPGRPLLSLDEVRNGAAVWPHIDQTGSNPGVNQIGEGQIWTSMWQAEGAIPIHGEDMDIIGKYPFGREDDTDEAAVRHFALERSDGIQSGINRLTSNGGEYGWSMGLIARLLNRYS